MHTGRIPRAVYRCYGLAWKIAIPFLKRNERLREGFEQRTVRESLARADLWIQAASAGEAYLAEEIFKRFTPRTSDKSFNRRPLRVLATANTAQGVEILEKIKQTREAASDDLRIRVSSFPFDHPKLMAKALEMIRPRLMVLLETEIWPGLLQALKERRTPVLIANGRLTARSLRRYRILPSFWHALCPDRILAISPGDAERYQSLFPESSVELMPNIKFDRIRIETDVSGSGSPSENHFGRIISSDFPRSDAPFMVLGSVRREEEEEVVRMIGRLLSECPNAVIGLFPRHLHRIRPWEKRLKAMGISWRRRTRLFAAAEAGQLILWDRFGELQAAYALASSVFVGGSLAPLGGQNFLEPLKTGIRPVIGPYWDDFEWVGSEIFDRGLVRRADHGAAAAEVMLFDVLGPSGHSPDRRTVRREMTAYLKTRQGGAERVCRAIQGFLQTSG